MTVLELGMAIGWAITALYFGLYHLFCKIRKEELVERLKSCEKGKAWLQKISKVKRNGER